SFGYASKEHRVTNHIDMRFDTASVTKLFTAVSTLQLVEKGILNLDDKITELVDLSGTKISDKVTIHHLLSHTSGIADDADEEAGEDYALLFIDKPNYAIRNCFDFLPNFAYKDPVFAPGANVRYNNCAYNLLGMALENKMGIDYRDYVEENIFKKAGMIHTGFFAKDEMNYDVAEGYFIGRDKKTGKEKWMKGMYLYPPVGNPDGGAYSTVKDLHRFYESIREGILLNKDLTKQILLPQSEFKRDHKYGYWQCGYVFEFIKHADRTFCIYKEGSFPGYDAILCWYPELNITLCLLANVNDCLWDLHQDIQQILFDEFQSKQERN
ncbi:beta-lactamase family protein, partial [Lachnospiraceae bacterium OttesenSCG-928-D06]|nr:beta-lactamase family protein [Lachnospiraceae bacterium OttesenSCG-928-D06]